MKIYRNSDNTVAPSWFSRKTTYAGIIEADEAARVSRLPETPGEEQVVAELDQIEACAKSKQTYHYSSRWPAKVTDELLEYASINGVKAVAVDPQDENLRYYASCATGLTKTASLADVNVPANPVNDLLKDPFHLDEKGDMQHMEKENWERVKPATKAQHPTVMMTSAGVINIGGESESKTSRLVQKVPGRNSILAENAIGESVATPELDTSARLRQEAMDRHNKHKEANKAADIEMVRKAEESEKTIPGAIPYGRVLATDARESSGAFTGGHIPDKNQMAELTPGEQLRARKQAKVAAAKARKDEDRASWDTAQGAGRHVIDSTFIEAIKKQLGES